MYQSAVTWIHRKLLTTLKRKNIQVSIDKNLVTSQLYWLVYRDPKKKNESLFNQPTDQPTNQPRSFFGPQGQLCSFPGELEAVGKEHEEGPTKNIQKSM